MIKLLTTHCPRCSVLQKKLDAAGIEYEEITDIETIQSYGVDAVPALVIPNMEATNSEAIAILDFTAAVKWVNDYNGGNQ
jgi:predicted DsbA family dithiol-disulfide isomerase